jgi:intracellular sulfur oxidation DsrE/DsrF family protein
MSRIFAAFLAAFLAAAPALAAETKLAEPAPSPDTPRRIVLTLTTADSRAVNNVMYNVANIQKFYGMDNVRLAVVAWGAGVRALLKEESPVADRVQSLQAYDVEFVACGNTLDAMGKPWDQVLPGVQVVRAGIPEVVERRLRGWVEIAP